MEQKLCIFMFLTQVSAAVWQRVTVIKGQTVDLSCPIINAQTTVEWKNPEGYIMFFKQNQTAVVKVFNNKRYSITKLSESKFTVSISDVTFKDGGNYTCSQYENDVTERTVELTVLDHPKITKTKHEGKFTIKCAAEGNHYPPQIFWKLNHGPEILALSQVLHEGKRHVSTAMIYIQSLERRVTVKCLVRHPALQSQPLMDFVKIGHSSTKSHRTTTTNSPTVQSQGSTKGQRTTLSWFRHGTAAVHHANVNVPSSESPINQSALPFNELQTEATRYPLNPVPSSESHLSTSNDSGTSVSSESTRRWNDTISTAGKTTSWTFFSETTEITSSNHTGGNRTGGFNEPKMQMGNEGSSSLLVLLVALLIFALLVVVIFIAIKLRKAHIIWKRENEDSDPSVESSQSKSCQEERNSQGPRRRGLFNMAFTQYVVEEPPMLASVIKTGAMAATESVNEEQTSQPHCPGQTSQPHCPGQTSQPHCPGQTSQPHCPGQTSAKCDIKETEL